MSVRVYFVRHGENHANVTKEFSSRLVDYPLTEKGRLQAQQTATFFTYKDIGAIFCSPLKRAAETAAIIGEALGIEPVPVEGFREVDVGALEGQPVSDALWDDYFRIIEAWRKGQITRHFPAGENYVEMWGRFRESVESAIEGRDGQNVVVVGHGGLFAESLKDLCPGSNVEWYRRFPLENCAITEVLVEVKESRISGRQLRGKLITWGATDHLTGQAAEFVPGLPSSPEH